MFFSVNFNFLYVMNFMKFKSGTPFTDSEFVKNYVLVVSEDVCSEESASVRTYSYMCIACSVRGKNYLNWNCWPNLNF
jgi:hypothetical protein